MAPRVSPVWPVQVAVDAALRADALLTALIGADGIFGDQVPTRRQPPYLTLGAVADTAQDVFMGPGAETGTDLHGWGRTREEAIKLYEHVARILGDRALPLDGHLLLVGRVALVTVLRDPSGLAHSVMRYTAETRARS